MTKATTAAAVIGDYLDDAARRLHSRLGRTAGVAISLADSSGVPVTVGASTPLARAADAVQYPLGSGPALEVFASHRVIQVSDLAADRRWGTFGRRAVLLGARTCLAVPVGSGYPQGAGGRCRRRPSAVVTVYGAEVGGLDAGQQECGRALAAHVSSGIELARTLHGLAVELDGQIRTMNHRRTVDLATGIVMERERCDVRRAARQLERSARDRDTGVLDIAGEITRAAAGVPAEVEQAPFRRRRLRTPRSSSAEGWR